MYTLGHAEVVLIGFTSTLGVMSIERAVKKWLMYRIGHQEELCTDSVHNSSLFTVTSEKLSYEEVVLIEQRQTGEGMCTECAIKTNLLYKIGHQEEVCVQTRPWKVGTCKEKSKIEMYVLRKSKWTK